MSARPEFGSPPGSTLGSGEWGLIVVGFAMGCSGLIALLTINGVSRVPDSVTAGTSALVVLGLVLPAISMLSMARSVAPNRHGTRCRLVMQAIGLVGLLVGVALIDALPSLSGYVIGACLVAVSGASALTGVLFFRRYAGNVVVSPWG